MSGLSKVQREILRLALTVNVHTQGAAARVKSGSPVPGYRIPTVDYAGPKDLRPPLVLWAIGGMQPSPHAHGFFFHTKPTRCIKASVTRATTRLMDRGMLVYAPLPKWEYKGSRPDPGYVLTAEGLSAAGELLDLPLLAEACELFGITRQALYEPAAHWAKDERHARKAELIETLRNGYRSASTGPALTVDDAASVTGIQPLDSGNRCEVPS